MAAVELGVPRDGLSLHALRTFAAEHADRTFSLPAGDASLPFAELTTAQVVEAVVKPLTEAAGCTYAELLLQRDARGPDGIPSVAPATVFVSHAWGYRFAELLATLEAHAATRGEAFAGASGWTSSWVTSTGPRTCRKSGGRAPFGSASPESAALCLCCSRGTRRWR